MVKFYRLSLVVLSMSFLLSQIQPLSAQESHQTISFQGFLTDEMGDTLNATVPIVFKIRNSGNNQLLWTETHDSVAVSGGIFHVLLGGITVLDDVDFDRPTDLGISVNGDPEMTPRTGLTAAPYAMNLRGALRVQLVDDNVDVFAADNIIGGYGWVNSGAKGVTISGGGNEDDFVVNNKGYSNYATIGGGFANTVGGEDGIGPIDPSDNPFATVGGGRFNSAFAAYSTVPGGHGNQARGRYSLAAGRFSHADHDGTFVWADSASPATTPFSSTAKNQFLIRAAGGVGIGTNAPDAQLDVAGEIRSSGPYSSTVLYKETNKSGIPDGDGFRIRYDGDFFQTNSDALVFEKTDGNASSPDGGIAFINSGTGGINNVAMVIRGDGRVGIGTKTPLKSLHVRGDYYGRGHIFLHAFGGDSTSGIAYVQARDLTTTTNIGLTLRTKTGSIINDAVVISAGGNVAIAGSLSVGYISKSAGSFRIDHPLDPKNKYLYHSFVESPDMMNVYNGNVVLDTGGAATVELPSYFEALNRDFRYQLTAIGAPGPNLYVADKISGNSFSIAGGSPGMEVSWQITGIRKDPYAEQHRIEVEVDKTADKRGSYLHPDAYAATNR